MRESFKKYRINIYPIINLPIEVTEATTIKNYQTRLLLDIDHFSSLDIDYQIQIIFLNDFFRRTIYHVVPYDMWYRMQLHYYKYGIFENLKYLVFLLAVFNVCFLENIIGQEEVIRLCFLFLHYPRLGSTTQV